MPTKTSKCLVAAVVGLSIAAGQPAAAGPAPRPPRAALLTVADLPPGYQPADDLTDIVRPGEPDPDICAHPIEVGSLVNRPAITAYTSFFRKTDGLLVYEILVAAGPARARRLVAEIARAPKKCPEVRLGDDLTLSLSRMNVPDVGERAAGVLIRTETAPPTRTRLIVFAEGGVSVVVMAVGARDAGLRGMHMIALAAAKKIANAN